MKHLIYFVVLAVLFGCKGEETKTKNKNPFMVNLNKAIDYNNVSANDVKEYAEITLKNVSEGIEKIKKNENPNFETVFIALDKELNELIKTSNYCFMMYWVSPDSATRANGLEGYQLLDSLSTTIFSDKAVFKKMTSVRESEEYASLESHRKIFVDDMILSYKQSGVNLEGDKLSQYMTLSKEITKLSAEYSNNMNTAIPTLKLDEEGTEGLPENFKSTYKVEDGIYEIPVMNATREPVLGNAKKESTRKAYYTLFYSRAADKNLEILDQLVQKRHELSQLLGYKSYAEFYLFSKMAKNPETVWAFVNDLVDRAKVKAVKDIELLEKLKKEELSNEEEITFNIWDASYYKNMLLKNEFKVDHEKIREYLPIEQCLTGVLDIYTELLGLEFKKIENPSVWHKDVEMYEVFEKNELIGRFYLDLFPRPNKESWFYGVGLKEGRKTENSYEIPETMLLGNFTAPTEDMPSLLSFKELNTLFHEFGHIIDALSYKGEFALQASAKSDFIESMSQIFENWITDYDMLSRFAKHYKTGEVLPKELFDNMKKAKNVSSGFGVISSLRNCIYDLNLYDKYNPESPVQTDELWKKIDTELGVMNMYIDDTHPQASWIHINTHPVYYYGYLWSEVYAQDMFSIFEQNGLTDLETGLRFRNLILANGSQRDAIEAVEEFLGRKSNNEAYIKSLGLN